MQHRIIVLGAGYAGAVVAGRLARRLRPEDVAVTLVNAEADFVERVRMHQLAVGQDLPPRPLDEMFAGTGVELRVARVTGVDVDRRAVTVVDANGAGELAYDTLVYALGSDWNDQGVPGVAEHAHQIAGRPGALRLRERLAGLTAGQPVVVVGGGLTGVEAVTEIAEARPDLDVALVARDGLGDWLSAKGRGHLRKVCDRLGVTVHEHAAVTGVEADRVTTADGGSVPAAVTVWTTGFAVHPIARATALEVTDTGRIVVDATMRSVSHPDVYAVGDAAMAKGVGGKPLRMSCASGVPMAWQAADAVAARLTGGKLPDTPLRYFNQCISLGRGEGLIQYVTGDDRAVRGALTGRLAAAYKELVCKGAAWGVAHPLLGPSRRRPVVREAVREQANPGAPASPSAPTGAPDAVGARVLTGSPVPNGPVDSTDPGVEAPA
ncbi:FAD-dependent oxidoreductase [Streptomyces sp. ID05-04B]|uniref:NAD(P)/FAD-dependent oxidoreductase n=1 Tax=unclassified Streptomyces TaxID=2593676 RepID=UPI000D1A8FED|nr:MULTISPECIES: FAD-dependent oxidoreductase [unclassified Streptomyces]AVV41778.1 oxidoreductase [Streptomyces sp. P3]MDX5569232.1 FAD-dependent oxidoreductase [Streptomyces sp. ID05-04B]